MNAPLLTTFVVDDRLPWPDDNIGAHESGPMERGTILDGDAHVDFSFYKIAPRGATLRTERPSRAGESLALCLDTGQRRQAVVEWVRGQHYGVRFDEPIDVVALINRTLVSQPAERRRMPRVELRCAVHVKWLERLEPSVMRNVSCTGMQVEGDQLPNAGTLVSLFVEGINLPAAELVWRQGNLAGFEFFEELSWSSVIAWIRAVNRS